MRGEGEDRGPVDAPLLLRPGVGLGGAAQGERGLSKCGIEILQRRLKPLAGVGVMVVAVRIGTLAHVGVDGVVVVEVVPVRRLPGCWGVGRVVELLTEGELLLPGLLVSLLLDVS